LGLVNKPGELVKGGLERLRSLLTLDRNGDFRTSVLLVGDGRSGTTWVSDIINYDNSYRYLFEPFHPCYVDLFKEFKYFQYIRPNSSESRFLEPVERVLTGRYRHPRADRHNWNFFCSRRLIKDIFAHLFLKWIAEQFRGIPIVLLLRHPCAVAVSKLNLEDFVWGVNPAELLNQTELVEDHLAPFAADIKRIDDEFEKHILHWAIVHYVPLAQFKERGIHMLFYEHLCTNREKEIQRLFAFLGKPFDPRVVGSSRRASVTSRGGSAVVHKTNLISSWRKKVTSRQRARARQILSLFGLDELYGDGDLPQVCLG
jgi:Sulfotransferase domain